MAISAENMDFINWSNFYKGSYRKGLERFETALDTPSLYAAMKQDPIALAVLLSKADHQSADIITAIQARGKGDEILEAYISNIYGSTDAFLALGAEIIAAMPVSYLSDEATAAILADSAAIDAMVGSWKALGAAMASDIARDAIAASSTAITAVLASDRASLAYVVGSAGLNPAEYTTLPSLMNSDTGMAALATSAVSLNMICKKEAMRAAWMTSPYAQGHYDTMYSTLHGASTSLFKKYETYYSSAYKKSNNNSAPLYTNSAGGFTSTEIEGTTHENAVPFAGITLLNAGAAYYGNDGIEAHHGSSQTKEDVIVVTGNSSLTTCRKVFVGGMSKYDTQTYGGSVNCTYATYTAV